MSDDTIETQEIIEDVVTADASTDSEERLKNLEAELAQKSDLIKQLRKYEKSQLAEKEKALAEQGHYKELYESTQQSLSELQSQIRNQQVDTVIREQLAQSGVKALDTALKILDRSKIDVDEDGKVNISSVQKLITEMQTTDAILFELKSVDTPAVKKVAEDVNIASFETEMRNAKSLKEINAILTKYNK